jgi:PAS domain S-box-containing protein
LPHPVQQPDFDPFADGASLLKAISDGSPDVIFAKDREGRMRFANPATLQLIGKSADEVLGHTDVEFLDDKPAARRVMENDRIVMESGVASEVEEVVPRPDGTARIWLSQKRPYRDANGRTVGLLGISRDITEQMGAEEARARLAAIVESSHDAILSKDLSGTIRSWNGGAERLLGYSRDEIVGRPIQTILPPDRLAEEEDILRRLDAGERIDDLETVRVARDGRRMDVAISVSPVRDATGRMAGASTIMRDIAERKRAEQRLQASESRYRALFENMTEGFALGEAIVDERGVPHDFRFIEVNEAFERQSGLGREVVGRPLREVLPNLEPHWVERYCGVALTGEPVRFSDFNRDTNRYYEVFSYSPSAGQFAIVFRDVTEDKRASEERERLFEQAEEANRLKDDFLATLSHELRTPLTAILGWARLLEEGGLPEAKLRQAYATIARNAEAQRQLLTDVLDVSHMISGNMRLEVREVDALDVVNHAAASIQPAVDAKALHLEIACETSRARLVADPDRLQQITWNLLSNAVKFTPPGGRITVTVRRHADTLDIVVSDTGIGIPPAFVPKLFARFAQADSSPSRRFGGLGLGLSIVRHLVELHGGSVSARSDGEGKGATITVSLPARSSARRHDAAPALHHVRPVDGHGGATLPGLHVLVVDDLEDARTMIATVLERAGARVVLASGAEEALARLPHVRPHLVLADIGMPGMDGYEFVRRLRALPPEDGGRTPVVALTAFGTEADRARALAAGFDDHVPKPVLPDELLTVTARASGRG